MEITWGQTVESSTIKVGKVINVGQVVPLSVLRLSLWLRLRLGDDGDLEVWEDVWPADHTGGGGRHPTGLTQHTAGVHPGLQSRA